MTYPVSVDNCVLTHQSITPFSSQKDKQEHFVGRCRSEGTIVSVGVRDDGTEVAVKRMLKSHSDCIINELRNLRLPELEMKNIVQYKVRSSN